MKKILIIVPGLTLWKTSYTYSVKSLMKLKPKILYDKYRLFHFNYNDVYKKNGYTIYSDIAVINSILHILFTPIKILYRWFVSVSVVSYILSRLGSSFIFMKYSDLYNHIMIELRKWSHNLGKRFHNISTVYNMPYNIKEYIWLLYTAESQSLENQLDPKAHYEDYFVKKILILKDTEVDIIAHSQGVTVVSEFLTFIIKYRKQMADNNLSVKTINLYCGSLMLTDEKILWKILKNIEIKMVFAAYDPIIPSRSLFNKYLQYVKNPNFKMCLLPCDHFLSKIKDFSGYLRDNKWN